MAFLDLVLGPAQHRPMRIRNIFVASLLTMTFGCPGDDAGDTDANTTPGTTTDTPGTTAVIDTTGEPPGTTTGTPGTSTGEPGTSSGEPPADSGSSTAGDSGSSSGGMVNAACEQFCSDYFAMCGDSQANDYGDMAGCENACGLYDQETFDCKEYHVSMADGPDSVHCSHANRDGGGVC